MEEVNIERPTSNIEVEESEEVTSALASSPGRATRPATPTLLKFLTANERA
jgi:hypothetical protein